MSQFQTWYSSRPRALRALITINVVLYVAARVFDIVGLDALLLFARDHLALNPALPGILLEPWQLVTYNFLHLGGGFGGLLHVGFNMLWLYWIGQEYEEMHGPHQLLALYVLGGIGGGLFTVLVYAALPGAVVVYGASASVLALLTAVAILYPYKKIALLFIGTVRLLYVVIGFLVIDILLIGGTSTAVAAHIGGALSGFLFARAERSGWDLTSWARLFFETRRRSGGGRPRSGPQRTTTQAAPSEDEGLWSRFRTWLSPPERASSERSGPAGAPRTAREERDRRNARENAREAEINRILDKISEGGYEALSDEEKRILEDASRG